MTRLLTNTTWSCMELILYGFPDRARANFAHVMALLCVCMCRLLFFTEEVITEVAEGQAEDVDLAVKAARAAFEKGSWWVFALVIGRVGQPLSFMTCTS